MKRRHAFLAALAALCLAPGSVSAQRASTGACPIGDGERIEVGFEGTVRDDESDVPLPGALVLLRYEEREGLETPPDVSTRTDQLGRYRFCGLEAFREVRVTASYLLRRGREQSVELERARTVDLVVDLGDPAFIVFTVASAETGAPIEGATVDLSPIPVGGITDSLGRVAFRAVPPGDYDLTVRHIAYADAEQTVELDEDQMAELRLELRTRAIAVAPIEVRVTGRDPYLLQSGFYERQEEIDGYFGTRDDIQTYTTSENLFRFNRALSIRYRRNQFILLNGRPISRLGTPIRELPFHRIRGIEAYPCNDAPDGLMIYIRADIPISDCNLIAIWTR